MIFKTHRTYFNIFCELACHNLLGKILDAISTCFGQDRQICRNLLNICHFENRAGFLILIITLQLTSYESTTFVAGLS